MRIPSGDLAPVRRSRRHRGSYGRRRRSGRGPLVAVLAVVLLAAAAAGVYVLRRDDTTAPTRTANACPTPAHRPITATTAAAVLPRPAQVRVVLLNGTVRNGLGHDVGNQLSARGFVVSGTGNAPATLSGASRVTFGPGGSPGARLVAEHVLGATVVGVPGQAPRTVQLVLGSGFVRLRTPAEVAGLSAPSPAAAPSAASAAGCP